MTNHIAVGSFSKCHGCTVHVLYRVAYMYCTVQCCIVPYSITNVLTFHRKFSYVVLAQLVASLCSGKTLNGTPLTSAFPRGAVTPLTSAFPRGAVTPLTSAFPRGAVTPLTSAFPRGAVTPLTSAFPRGAVTPLTSAFPRGAAAAPVPAAPSPAHPEQPQSC